MNTTLTESRLVTATRWSVDPENSSVEFAVKTFWGLATVHGRFDGFAGSYVVGPDGRTIDLTIDADSLDTGNRTRDKHLRSNGFFNVTEHPQLRFTSELVHEVEPGLLHVAGRLEAAGKSVRLDFPAFMRQIADELEIEATTTVDQRELGMSTGTLGVIRRPATLYVRARLTDPTGEEE